MNEETRKALELYSNTPQCRCHSHYKVTIDEGVRMEEEKSEEDLCERIRAWKFYCRVRDSEIN